MNINYKHAFIAFAISCLTYTPLVVAGDNDQLKAAPPRVVPKGLPIDSKLYEAMLSIPEGKRRAPGAEDLKRIQNRGMTLRGDGKVLSLIIGPGGTDALAALNAKSLKTLGVELGMRAEDIMRSQPADAKIINAPLTSYENYVEAWLPIASLVQISQTLPPGYRLEPILPPDHDAVIGQGPAVTNSDSYSGAGFDGGGLTIAVVDGGYQNYTAAVINGDAPVGATLINYTGAAFESGGTHGTGCVEAAFDHAPGATWRIYKTDSIADLGTVVTNAIATGVDIITHSLSRYNLGWADNTGAACSAANSASANGIVFFTSAGNRAQSHFQGSITDVDGDNWLEFGGGDETIDVTIAQLQRGNHYLSWSNAAADLDFYLYDASLTTVVASSTTAGIGIFEAFYYQNLSPTATFHLAIRFNGGIKSGDIEIFSHNSASWNQHIVAENSTTSPSNCTGSRIQSVGAVAQSLFGQPNGSDVIKSYSSRGPSNSGMTLPDITGPTDTAGFTYPAFGGTSAATPNAAGAAAAFWSSNTQLHGYAIQWLVKEQADLWRDWGAAGNDNTYGKGGVQLIDYSYSTRWLARNYPGTADLPDAPYYTTQGIHDAVPSGGRVLIYGNSYPEPALLGETGKSMMLVPVPDTGSVTFGE